MLTIPSRVIAACFALVGFAAAVVVGAVAGNVATTVLLRALVVMAVCWAIGRLVGFIAGRAVAEHLGTYKQQNPIPDETETVGRVDVDVEPELGETAAQSAQPAHEVASST